LRNPAPRLVHSEDLAAFRSLSPYGRVFECVAETSRYVTLSCGGKKFRVSPELFRPVPAPRWRVGQDVVLKGDGRSATIVEMAWHHQREQAMYFLLLEGKKKSRRYWESDFVG
jgi:hypothetical protein